MSAIIITQFSEPYYYASNYNPRDFGVVDENKLGVSYDATVFKVDVRIDEFGLKFVRYQGVITYTSGEVLSAYLNRFKPDYLVLNSRGGHVVEIIQPGEIIREQGIFVKIDKGTSCDSACAFLATYSPYVQINGSLSFHNPSWEDFPPDSMANAIKNILSGTNANMLRTFIQNGFGWHLYHIIRQYSSSNVMITFDDATEFDKFRTNWISSGNYRIHDVRT